MRQQQLEKQQQLRARAAAAKPSPVPPVAPAVSNTTAVTAPTPLPAPVAQRPVAVPPPAASPPLHPSLPAKPGTTPISLPVPNQPTAQITPVQTPVPVPTQVSLTPALPARPQELSDPLIKSAEEVRSCILFRICFTYILQNFFLNRTNSDCRGWLLELHVISICIILVKSEMVTFFCLRKKLRRKKKGPNGGSHNQLQGRVRLTEV